jgi:2'-deoxynucleoside 5'-phosphate N-hydrolase
MPTAYLAVKYHPDASNRPHIESILAELEKLDYETRCVVRDVEGWGEQHLSAEDLMQKTFALIDASDTVVVDLTEKGVGVGIEAGYAYAKGKPVFTIAKRGSDISTTLSGISSRIAWYNDYSEISLLLAKQ